jgi:hypothetical protein
MKMKFLSVAIRISCFILFIFYGFLSFGQTPADLEIPLPAPTEEAEKKDRKWFNSFSIRGYGQFRYNRLLETNSDLKCEQCDRSWGGDGGFFMRRLRVILYGNIHDRVYFYIQPDFASSSSASNLHFGQIRDAYMDLAVDKKKQFRFRIGQSKVPFGFENMQSSQNRLALDRNDALNSAVSNERDLGAFFMFAPQKTRALFSELTSKGFKGSGDYGVFAFGVYNGQTANRPEANDNKHLVARLTYPFETKKGQIIEASIQGYTGKYVVSSITEGVETINDDNEYRDQRVAASFIIYPKPFGFQTEFNYGRGPEYNPTLNKIEEKRLFGGYAQAHYLLNIKKQTLIPFAKYQYYEGGKKHELDARSYRVSDFEIGVEWQPIKYFELVAIYTVSQRRFEDAALPINDQKGNLLRLQAQFNF